MGVALSFANNQIEYDSRPAWFEFLAKLIGSPGRFILRSFAMIVVNAEDLVPEQGVYAIRNKKTGWAYIGQSVQTSARWAKHITNLTKGIHNNKEFQGQWDEYGASAFDLFVVERVADKEKLLDRENVWINAVQSYHYDYPLPPPELTLHEEVKAAMDKWKELTEQLDNGTG